ncbi:MAG: 50S ribosomal protein L22 [Candidatus Parcubacteria bacterium]|nr:50S ribosomal protein L22 [Candidatus Parcubacteria bacterium]
MQVIAKLNYLRMSPKKLRLIADIIRGMKVEAALTQLAFINKLATRPVIKLLDSAISNAENNFNLKRDNLFVKEIKVDMAGMLKRWQYKAHGRATPLRKRNAHILLILDELVPTKVKAKKVKAEKPVKVKSLEKLKEKAAPEKLKLPEEEKITREHEKETEEQPFDVRLEGKHRHKQHEDKRNMKGDKGFIKKIFNRKSG